MTSFIIDPTGAYKHAPRDRIIDTCGIIPHWFRDSSDFKRAIEDNYPFLGSELEGKVEQGVYKHLGDPDLAPYMQIHNDDETAFIYPYGIIGVIHDETQNQYIVRCD